MGSPVNFPPGAGCGAVTLLQQGAGFGDPAVEALDLRQLEHPRPPSADAQGPRGRRHGQWPQAWAAASGEGAMQLPLGAEWTGKKARRHEEVCEQGELLGWWWAGEVHSGLKRLPDPSSPHTLLPEAPDTTNSSASGNSLICSHVFLTMPFYWVLLNSIHVSPCKVPNCALKKKKSSVVSVNSGEGWMAAGSKCSAPS